jgi:alkylhydroperoxidase family enzyme
VGRKNGLTERQLTELHIYETSDAFDELERLVIRFATHLSQAHVAQPDDLIAKLRPHLNDAQIVELTSAIAWENYRARFNRAFGVQAAGFTEGATCARPIQPNLNLNPAQ